MVYLLRPAPVAETKPAKKTAAAPTADSFAIKFFVPAKKGDRREVTVVEEIKIEAEAVGGPPEAQAELKKFFNVNAKVTLRGVVKTLEVDTRGKETDAELTLGEIDIVQKGEKRPQVDRYVSEFPPGTVLTGKRTDGGWILSNSNKQMLKSMLKPLQFPSLPDLFADDYGGWPDSEADHLIGTSKSQLVGGTWSFRSLEIIGNRLKTHETLRLLGFNNIFMVKANGNGKFVKVTSNEDKNWLEVDIAVDAKMEQKEGADKFQEGSVSTQLTWNLRLPGDGSTGPARKVGKFKLNAETSVPPQPGLEGGMKIKYTVTTVETYDIKYGITGEQPVPQTPRAEGQASGGT